MRNNLTISTTIETIPSYVVAEMMDKKHKEVLTMIQGTTDRRGIIDILGELQMEPSEFFIESTYISSQNKEVKCYECTRMGCDMLANKMTGDKGMIFTAKYVKAFNEMKQQLMTQQPLALPSYSFSNYWIKREIASMKPTDIPDYIDNLLEHTKLSKANDRLTTYEVARSALQDLQPTFTEAWQREMIQASLNKLHGLVELQKTYINRADKGAKTKKINRLEQELEEWKTYSCELEEYYNPPRIWHELPIHGFSVNYMFDDNHNATRDYRAWLNKFPKALLPTREELERQGVCLNKRNIVMEVGFIHCPAYDVDNLVKSLIDVIFGHHLHMSDNLIIKVIPSTIATCDDKKQGEIHFCIYNTDEVPHLNSDTLYRVVNGRVELLESNDDDEE